MTEGESWELTASIAVAAPARVVYALVSDVTRMGEWSPECRRGEWTSGPVGGVGARFVSENCDGEFGWVSESEVIAAVPNRRFGFTVLVVRSADGADGPPWVSRDRPGEVTWMFSVERDDNARQSNSCAENNCVLIQRHVMRSLSALYLTLLAKADAGERPALLAARRENLHQGMNATLSRIKAVAEQQASNVDT